MDGTGNAELNFCYNCMTHLNSGEKVCPVCGHNNTLLQNPENTLPEGTILAGKYLVGKILGQGGFGITYLGFDTALNIKVAIKEYFPAGVGIRSPHSIRVTAVSSEEKADGFRKGCDEFQEEARRLAAIESPNIVKVRDYFRENGTAYIIMNYLEGGTLSQEVTACGGKMPWRRVVDLFNPLILELDKIHKEHLIHRDIKPDNIKVVKDKEGAERLVLLDFGAARSFISAEVTGTYSAMVSHGYAPIEQYTLKSRQGPFTDIYALCATMYAVLTGTLPADATDRILGTAEISTFSKMSLDVPESIEKAIFHGLEVRSDDRPQSMRELYDELNGKEPVIRQSSADIEKTAQLKEEKKEEVREPAVETPPQKKPNWLLPVLLAILLAAGFFLYRGIRRNQLNTAGTQTAEGKTITRSALELALQQTVDGQNTQIAQTGMTEQAAAAGTQSAQETQEALHIQQTGTAWNITAAAEYQQTQTQEAIEASATQAEQANRMEQTVQAETQFALNTAAAVQSAGTSTAWFTTQEAQLHQTQTREAEEIQETAALYAQQTVSAGQTAQALEQTRTAAAQQTATKAALNEIQTQTAIAERTAAAVRTEMVLEQTRDALQLTQAAFHIVETEMSFQETQMAIDMRLTGVAATKTKAAEPTETPTPTETMTPTMTASATMTPTASSVPTMTNTPIPTETPVPANTEQAVKAGDIITLGHYEQDNDLSNGPEAIEWQVLAVEDGKALVISNYSLDTKPYNEEQENVTWETSSLRAWLNSEFYNSSFSSTEKDLIRQTAVRNPNGTGGTKGGNNTIDRIFLLSIDEANQYFGEDEARKCWPTAYAKNNGAIDSKTHGGTTWWWLRSPGLHDYDTAGINTAGLIYDNGYNADDNYVGVRPAFWLDLNAAAISEILQLSNSSTSTQKPTDKPDPVYLVISDTSLRDKPSNYGIELQNVLQGTELTYTGQSKTSERKTWIHIRTEDGNEGWIEKDAAALKKNVSHSIKVGELITLGHYEQDNDLSNGPEAIEWQVLAVENGRALVISKYGLDSKQYNEKMMGVTWETCTLRTWLNGDFYNTAFSSKEKELISEVTVKNPNNSLYITKGGNDTTDRLFLLSIDEANTYFKDDEARQCRPTAYAIKNGINVSDNYGATTWWWLRSPGSYSFHAADVRALGNVYMVGYDINRNNGAVRPAFWLDLDAGTISVMPETPMPSVTPTPTAAQKPTSTPKPAGKKNPAYLVISDTLLRDRPSNTGIVVRSALQGTLLFYTGESKSADGKNWIHVRTESGIEGWINKSTVIIHNNDLDFRKVGDVFTMGHYEQDNNLNNGPEAIEWQVLAIEDGHALIISKYGLEAKQYNDKYARVTWETGTLRTWLNREFYNSAFSNEEKGQIRQVTIKNPDNAKHGTKGGNVTTDRIFLLSIDEAKQYFANNQARKCWPTAYAKKNGANVSESSGGSAWWWLRTPGSSSYNAAIINNTGNIIDSGYSGNYNSVVVRPAFWMVL